MAYILLGFQSEKSNVFYVKFFDYKAPPGIISFELNLQCLSKRVNENFIQLIK